MSKAAFEAQRRLLKQMADEFRPAQPRRAVVEGGPGSTRWGDRVAMSPEERSASRGKSRKVTRVKGLVASAYRKAFATSRDAAEMADLTAKEHGERSPRTIRARAAAGEAKARLKTLSGRAGKLRAKYPVKVRSVKFKNYSSDQYHRDARTRNGGTQSYGD